MVYLIAAWAIITGAFEVAAAIRLRKLAQGEWMLALAGVLSIAFGILISLQPSAGMMGLVVVIGVYALIFGALEIGLAFRLRGAQQRLAVSCKWRESTCIAGIGSEPEWRRRSRW
jgi:uncharacterized membrane protein HdeD (DUF308 family)